MKIAYLTYWSINEGLSQATSIPHIKVLNNFSQVEQIDYYTFEKEESIQNQTISPKINHYSLKRCSGSSLINKIKDYHRAWKTINSNHKCATLHQL